MTSLLHDPSPLLKTDKRGRVHVSRERREALLDEWERGGTSAPEFCRLTGINYATFMGWRARRQRQRRNDSSVSPPSQTVAPVGAQGSPRPVLHFLEAVLEPSARCTSAPELAVELPGGARLRLESAAQLPLAAELLRWLAQPERRSC